MTKIVLVQLVNTHNKYVGLNKIPLLKITTFILFAFHLTLIMSACQTKPVALKRTKNKSNDCLLSISDFKKSSEKQKLKVIDVREQEEFLKGHIPEALNLCRKDLENPDALVEGTMASKLQMELLLGKLGIRENDFIVIYDNKGNSDACRLFWILDYYGHAKKAILNGGLSVYEWCFKTLSRTIQKPEKHPYKFKRSANPKNYIAFAEVEKAVSDTHCVIIDCRSPEEFNGSMKKEGASRAGRIPNSISLDYELNLDKNNQLCFKNQQQLLQLYQSIPRYKKVICYCHSGVRSALSTFVLSQLLDYPNVKNYDGSWIEWSAKKK